MLPSLALSQAYRNEIGAVAVREDILLIRRTRIGERKAYTGIRSIVFIQRD